MTDHDVIVALVMFDVLMILSLIAVIVTWKLAEHSARREISARHARPKADAK